VKSRQRGIFVAQSPAASFCLQIDSFCGNFS
jgi:hypothetical protein